MKGINRTRSEAKLAVLARFTDRQKPLAEKRKPPHTEGMNKPYSELKHDLIQILGTAIAVAGLVVPLLMWGIDAKFDGVKTSIDGMDKRAELRQAEADKRWEQRQAMYEKYIDAKLDKKP